MIVQIKFEIDLNKLYERNKTAYLIKDMSFEDMVTELKLLYGSNFERLNQEILDEYEWNFLDQFNY